MSDRALRREMARDLHHCGVSGDLETIADFLISRRGWTNSAPTSELLPPVLQPMIQDDAPNAVRIAITGFTHDGAPVLGNVARTAAQRISEARVMRDSRRGQVER